MKKVALLAMAAMAFFSCSQDEMPTTPGSNEEPVVILKINVQGAIGSRSIEDEHSGNTNDKVLPKIFNGAIIPYNEHGAALSAIPIDKTQLKDALIGSYIDFEGNEQINNEGGGIKIGLPRGTKRVDIVLNRFTAAEKGITNINYFNMQDYKDLSGNPIENGTKNNFERVALVTKFQGVGMELLDKTKETAKSADKPAYELEFSVAPNLARFEVFGAINVKKPEIWTDKYGNQWHEISKEEFKGLGTGVTDKVTFDETTGVGTDYGLMQANDKNGFLDKDGAVYIPKYYWHTRTGIPASEPEKIDDKVNVFEREYIDDIGNETSVGWVKQGDPFTKYLVDDNIVKWNPNAFYAIDVEEIFINNIKIRDASYDPSMHSWPGSASPLWKEWYNAFHLFGWHPKGVSDDNTFLCRANMWDRIAGSTAYDKVEIPGIVIPPGSTSETSMEVLTGKAIAIGGKSGYADTDRNLGITLGKAAAYQIYSQSSTLADNDGNKNGLANALPHIILKVKAYKTAQDYKDGKKVQNKEFITINLFKNGTARIRSFDAGYIYRLNMNDLRSSFVGEIPVPGGVSDKTPTDPIEPDPEMPGADLTVTVNITPWTIINMTPEI